jgi:8-amino-7-oxononanoate synthase
MPLMQSPPGAVTQIDGRECLYFVGTGYLGLQSDPAVIRAACEATERYGIHSATTRAGFGNSPPTLLAEQRTAELFGTEAAFYFASGYASNSILLAAIQDQFDALFIDALAHYSVQEAARQSGRPVFGVRHRDPNYLQELLQERLRPGQRPLVLSDGVFSVRGTIAPVAEYRRVLAGYPGAALFLDDAHAVGVLGQHGRGTFEQADLSTAGINADSDAGDGLFLTATASKALGGFGGIIPGSRSFIERVKKASHWFDGASAPVAAAAAATARAIELVMAEPSLRGRLHANVRLLKDGLRRMGFEANQTCVPIVCLEIGSAENMQRIQRGLWERGIAIAYMAAYSGLGAEGALRIAVFATHTEEMIRRFLDELRRLV